MLWRNRGAFVDGRLFWPTLRKILKSVGPLLLLLGLGLALLGPTRHPVTFALAGLGALGAAISAVLPERLANRLRLLRIARCFTLAMTAYFTGLVRFLSGSRHGLWRRDLELPISFDRPAIPPLSVRAVKRTVDVLAASFALLLLWPVMLWVAWRIRRESPGPAFYVQDRLRPGPSGEPIEFKMYKFRSMRTDAEQSGPQWSAGTVDPRITPFGHVIRKHRLDELPQFINILRGDMSLVGPRPERAFFASTLDEKIPGFNDRHMVVRPGLTGWAQVNCGYADDKAGHAEKLSYDMAYIAHLYRLSTYLRMEFNVVLKTFSVVFSGCGPR